MDLGLEFPSEQNRLSLLGFQSRDSILAKSLQQMGNQQAISNESKFMEDVLNPRKRAGRPSIDDDTLSADRDALVWLLSVSWGEVGWLLPRATTPEELRQAFAPLRNHPHEDLVTRFVRETSICATAKAIRKTRKVHGEAIQRLRAAQQRISKSADGRVLAEAAMTDSPLSQQAPMFSELISAWGEASEARRELKAAEERKITSNKN